MSCIGSPALKKQQKPVILILLNICQNIRQSIRSCSVSAACSLVFLQEQESNSRFREQSWWRRSVWLSQARLSYIAPAALLWSGGRLCWERVLGSLPGCRAGSGFSTGRLHPDDVLIEGRRLSPDGEPNLSPSPSSAPSSSPSSSSLRPAPLFSPACGHLCWETREQRWWR